MSTFRSELKGPPEISHDWRRNRNASPKICQPRLRASEATSASGCPLRCLEPVASASATPARKRNSGAPKPASTINGP